MIKQLNKSTVETVGRPVRILQFGEGNFLRAFVDWQIDIANEKGVMDAGVAVCQPIIDPERKVLGMIDLMHRQDNMYHVYLEGIENKRPKKDVRLVKSIMDSFNPYVDYAKYEAYFLSPELKITISNTTEAGIRYEEGDDLTACPPKSYPAKMTALLYKRFIHFNGDPTKGLCIICCELIENNGSTLHEYVIRHAEYHKLGQDFIDWVENSCHFCDTLVDRIVPGFPREQIASLYLCGGLASMATMRLCGGWIDQGRAQGAILLTSLALALLTLVGFALPAGLPLYLLFTLFMALSSARASTTLAVTAAIPAPHQRAAFMSFQGSVTNVAAGLGSLFSATYLVSDEGGALHGFPTLAWINIACTLVACAGVWFLIRGLKRTRDNNNPASGTARQGSQ